MYIKLTKPTLLQDVGIFYLGPINTLLFGKDRFGNPLLGLALADVDVSYEVFYNNFKPEVSKNFGQKLRKLSFYYIQISF